LREGYRGIVARVLHHRLATLLVFALAGGGAWWLFRSLPGELSPLEDRGFFIGVMLAPDGATMQYTDRYARQWEQFYKEVPEVKSYFVVVAPGLEKPNPVNFALSFVRLQPWEERTRSQMDITQELGGKMFGAMPGVLSFPVNPPSLGQSFRNPPLQFVVQAGTYDQLNELTEKLLERARRYPGLANVDSDLKLNKPQLAVEVDRDKAATLGVRMQDIGRTLETLLGGREVTRFKREGEQYDVILRLSDEARSHPEDIYAITVRGVNGSLNQLSNLVAVRETVAPKELNHFNRQRAAIISANITPGYTLGQALEFMDRAAAEVLDGKGRTELDGQSREFRESSATLYLTFVLALAFIYLVLAAQFESFVGPFVIMLTVPLAMTGALLALKLTGGTLNVYSQIGLVMLIGLITKHGILIVEFANQLRGRGMDRFQAVTEAAALRLRPILMTTGAMVLGAVPLAVAHGAGAETRQPIGWVVVGGLLLGTLLTLFVIPTAYTLIVRDRKKPDEARLSPEAKSS
jgi:multidrug efflux pump